MKAKALLVSALLAAGPLSAGPWTSDGPTALADTGSAVAVGVVIHADDNCDIAQLAISGNYDISGIGLIVDGTTYGHAEAVYPAEGIAVVTVEGPALRALKSGTWAIVVTDQGSVRFGLEGSRKAIDNAYAACMATLRESLHDYLKPLAPSMPAGGVSF